MSTDHGLDLPSLPSGLRWDVGITRGGLIRVRLVDLAEEARYGGGEGPSFVFEVRGLNKQDAEDEGHSAWANYLVVHTVTN